MTTRFLSPLGFLSAALGMLALLAGARGYPFLLIAAGGVLLALLCIRPGACSSDAHTSDGHTAFSMPSVGTCPPERLQQARVLAARVVEDSLAREDAHHREH